MASDRLLTSFSRGMLAAALVLVVFAASASAQRNRTIKRETPVEAVAPKPVAGPATAPAPDSAGLSLAPYRSRLSDLYYIKLQQQVNPFDIRPAAEDTIPQGDSGFRIQLMSTRSRTAADSLFTLFTQWADTVQLGYKLYGYFEFRSPDYRIQTGDFYRLHDANALAARLAELFPGAWVVHAKIIQDRSPYYQRMRGGPTESVGSTGKKSGQAP